MSMILEALSRAEQERRSDNDVGLDPARYVGSSSIKEDRLKKWILLALLANIVLVMLFLVGYLWMNAAQQNEGGIVEKIQLNQDVLSSESRNSGQTQTPSVQEEHKLAQDAIVEQITVPTSSIYTQLELTDQPALSLQDEAKVSGEIQTKVASKKIIKGVTKKSPPVRYASQPLSQPAKEVALPKSIKYSPDDSSARNYIAVSDLSPVEQSQLSQYIVNVHVYDSNVQNRFVLINMAKYKEGDRLPGGGPLVSAITPEGVVIDYGSRKALLKRN